MIIKYVLTIAALVGLMALWFGVQALVRRHFPEDANPEGDVLAGKARCGNCICSGGSCLREEP